MFKKKEAGKFGQGALHRVDYVLPAHAPISFFRPIRHPKIVVLTDLDGTLLDTGTYSWRPAQDALTALRNRGASIVPVSSKTLAEMRPLYQDLNLSDPFIVENGGGIVSPAGLAVTRALSSATKWLVPTQKGEFVLFPLGRPYRDLVTALDEISREVGCPLQGFSSMQEHEVASLTGLNLGAAGLAQARAFDEPFVVTEGCVPDEPAMQRAAASRGLRIVQGDRFRHLIGHAGKGVAVAIVLKAFQTLYSCILSIGLGNSPNDFDFLEKVDVPVLLGFPPDKPGVPASLAYAGRFAESGPRAWNEAVLDLLEGPKGRKT